MNQMDPFICVIAGLIIVLGWGFAWSVVKFDGKAELAWLDAQNRVERRAGRLKRVEVKPVEVIPAPAKVEAKTWHDRIQEDDP